MTEAKVKVSNNGIGFLSLLGLTFIILKLCGVITWSWIWVLAPFWGLFGIIIAILFIFASSWIIIKIVGGIANRTFSHKKTYRRR